MKLRGALVGLALAAITAAAPCTWAADAVVPGIALKIAWLRPAAAGMAEAQAYVDIANDTGGDLELVGATTPFAKRVELVYVNVRSDAREQKVVASMPVPAGKTTRLAYNGSHLRLLEITKDFGNGTAVPLTLAFKSAEGKDVSTTVNAQVRGLLTPQKMPAAMAKEPAPAVQEVTPAAKEATPAKEMTPAQAK